MPSAPSFDKLCRDQHIPIPPKPDRTAYLTNAAVPPPSPATASSLNERCATLAWARHSINSKVDPDTWPTLVDASLLPRLLALYTLPPARPSDGPISDIIRLARAVALYMPGDPVAPNMPPAPLAPQPPLQQPPPPQPPLQPPPQQTGSSHHISTAQPSLPLHTVAPGPQPPPPPNPLASLPLTSASCRKSWMMHEQLCHLLPEPVYNALRLDASAGLSASERAKVLSACKKNELGTLLDNTTSAAFGHQFSLALHEGAHFDAVKRGFALAAAAPQRPPLALFQQPSTSSPATPCFLN
jgi:hypothetical protein